MENLITETVKTDWKDILLAFPKWKYVSDELEKEMKHKTIYPPQDVIFAAFNQFDIKDTKVVIIGQDCYHTPGVANGLAFSTAPGKPIPPSLKNIFKEIQQELPGTPLPADADLTRWSKQGVLLINMALTVRKGEAGSHSYIWQSFATFIIREISRRTDHVVFLLWGNHARAKKAFIDEESHLILEAGHPSPLSVSKFMGCGHFIKANEWLTKHDKQNIDW